MVIPQNQLPTWPSAPLLPVGPNFPYGSETPSVAPINPSTGTHALSSNWLMKESDELPLVKMTKSPLENRRKMGGGGKSCGK
jgi:hypothetical protein